MLLAIARLRGAVERVAESDEPSVLAQALLSLAGAVSSWLTAGNGDVNLRVLCPDPAVAASRLALVRAARALTGRKVRSRLLVWVGSGVEEMPHVIFRDQLNSRRLRHRKACLGGDPSEEHTRQRFRVAVCVLGHVLAHGDGEVGTDREASSVDVADGRPAGAAFVAFPGAQPAEGSPGDPRSTSAGVAAPGEALPATLTRLGRTRAPL